VKEEEDFARMAAARFEKGKKAAPRGWVYIAANGGPPEMMTLAEWILEERWRKIRIVDEGGWLER
jgi:hypothetical protein